MATIDIEAVLLETLADRRLSRAERRALGEVLAEHDELTRSLFRHKAFELARAHLDGGAEGEAVLGWLEEVVAAIVAAEPAAAPPSRIAEVWFSPGDGPLRRITGLLRNARRAVDICVFTLTDDRIAEAVLETHARGVAVRIIGDDEKAWDKGSDMRRLAEAGIPVRFDHDPAHMHHKFALFDDETLLTGSYNWTRGAAEENAENILVSDDARLVRRFREEFERLWVRYG